MTDTHTHIHALETLTRGTPPGEPDHGDLGELVRALIEDARRATGTSYAEIGRRTDTARASVHGALQTGKSIHLNTLRAYSDVMGYDVEISLIPRKVDA